MDRADLADLNDGRKRAALAIVGLHPRDRRWLLAQLPDAERRDVEAMAAELQALHPEAPAASWAALAEAAWPPAEPMLPAEVAPPAPVEALGGTAVQRLAGASPAAVLDALADEPDATLALVLALRRWPWASAVVAGLAEPRRRALTAARAGLALPPPAVAQALVEALAERVAARDAGGGFEASWHAVASEPPAAPARATGWRAWWRR